MIIKIIIICYIVISLCILKTGEYSIKIYGSNDAEEKSDEFEYKMIIGEFLGELTVTDFNITTDFGEIKNFEIDFASPKMCVNVDYGDGSQPEKYGPKEACDSNFTNSKYMGEASSIPFSVSHVYEKRNYYKAVMTVFDEYSNEETIIDFLVNDFPYVPRPAVYIRINSTDFRNPIQYVCSRGHKVETQALLPRIKSSYSVINGWKVVAVDPKTGQEMKSHGNPLLKNCPKSVIHKSSLFLEPRCLKYGIYKVTSIYNVTTSEMDPEYPFYIFSYTYLNVTKGDLHASLIDGNILDIVRGYGQTVNLTGKTSSLDFDDPDNKDFKMVWYCRRLGEQINEEGPKQDIPEPTGDFKHENKGGCFGNGPGYVNVPDGIWRLNTKSFYSKDDSYVISLDIEKDTRNSSTYVLLHIKPYAVPILHLECSNPALCTQIREGVSINGVTRLSMKVTCLEMCEGIEGFAWKIRNLENEENDPDGSRIENSESYIIGGEERLIAVTLDFFTNHSDIDTIAVRAVALGERQEAVLEASNHTMELNHKIMKRSTTDDNTLTYIGMKFYINKPPYNGTCEILEYGKRACLDHFIIECKDWIDPEGLGIDTYKIYSVDDIGRTNILVSSTSTKFNVLLKPGKLHLYVDIGDLLGAKNKSKIGDVDVDLISDEELENFVDTKELDYLKCTGNQFQYMQAMQCWAVVASVIYSPGSAKLDDTERVSEISQTITDNIHRLDQINMNTFDDVEMVANSAGTLVGTGRFLDRGGKNAALAVLDGVFERMNIPNNSITFITPIQATVLFQNSFSVLGGVSSSIAKTIVHGEVVPNDMKMADTMEYDTSVDDDPNFVVYSDVDAARKRNVKENSKKDAQKHSESMKGIVKDAVDLVLNNLVPGENPIALDTEGGLSIYFISARGNESSDLNATVGDADFQLPFFCDLINNNTNETSEDDCDLTVPLGVAVLTWPTLLDVYTDTVDNLAKNSKIVEIQIYSGGLASEEQLAIKNSSLPIDIFIPRTPSDGDNSTSEETVVIPKMKWFEDLMYHQLTIDKEEVSINIIFSTDATSNIYLILLRYGKKPKLDTYDLKWLVNYNKENYLNNVFETFITSQMIKNQVGNFYIGVSQLLENVTEDQVADDKNITKSMVNREWNDTYTMKTITSSCWYFDETYKEWSTKGCSVIEADVNSTHCQCNHLTSFGGGLVVPPNPIDFSYVFANASFTDNLTIYITIIVTLVFFLIFLIWARCKDRRDVEKIGALPLGDNNEDDKYLYEVLVFTSDIKGASCDSRISFILSGDRDETDIRTFGIPPRKCFRKSGVDVFVMAVPRPLGQLQFLRIWHDNSGKGDFASWYMNYIIFHDVQTGEKFEFIGDTWFALEKGDGQIDRIITVADKEKLTEFGHLFSTTSRKNLTDSHLWFSVFLRPPRSRFTRCQRVCSCMAILYLSMLVNAMWYGTMPDKPSNGLSLGPFNLTPEQISVGFFSNIIIFPPSFLILFLFRKSRPRKLRPSRIDEALKQQNKNAPFSNNKNLLNEKKQSNSSKTDEEAAKPLKYQRKRRFTLPWWCTIIAWFLCISCILLSVFFLWAYGIQFGNEKTKKWITSLIVSVFTSILITQPIKVFLLAMFFSAVCKKVETDQDDADEDEEDPHLKFDEQWLHEGSGDPIKPRRVAYKLTNSEEVERAREMRVKETKMWQILREILAYMFFLWILSVVGFGMRDSNAILMYKTLTRNFLDLHKTQGYKHIQTIDDYWNWASEKLLYNLRVKRAYNNEPPYGMKGFLNDRVNRIMGFAIMRQIRYKPGECTPPGIVRQVMNCTGTHTSVLDDDENDYNLGWNGPPPSKEVYSRVEKAFKYETAKSLNGYPVLGSLAFYSGGGYVYELSEATDNIKADFESLKQNNWIDQYTKALFVEFSVYNAQVNLFGVIDIMVEFGPAGSILPDYNIEAIQLLPHESISGTFILVCEIIYILFIFYYTFTELRKICKLRGQYFRQFSSLAEWSLILLSYTAIAFYILRHIAVQDILKTFKETKGNKYINLQKCQYLNHCFTYLLSFIIFIAILKFIKLLRFNKRMSALSDTLKQCASDLWGFGLVILIVFIAFGQMFYLVFSSNTEDYSSMIHTLETLVSVTLNKFEFQKYTDSSSRMLGPVLFFAFSFLMSIILINLFLTIVIQSFQAVKHDLSKQSNDYEIVDFFLGRVKGFFGLNRNRKKKSSTLAMPKLPTEERSHPTSEFPEKVDRLLQYINSVYFDGKMDLNSKDVMMYRKKKFNFHDGPHVFSSDM